MNLEDVSRYIQQPSQLTLGEAEALKSMSEKHPYAAVFSLLYLTALANGKSIDLDQALQQHAYRLNDRTQLYYLVNPETTATDNAKAIAEPNILVVEPTETPVIEIPLDPLQKSVPDPSSEDIEAATAVDVETAATFSLETEAFTLEQAYIPEPPVVVELPAEPKVEEEEQPILAVAEQETTPQNESVSVPVIPVAGEKRSFTSWLKSNHSDPQPKEHVSVPAEDKARASDLIDRFIAEEPTISRPKNEFFSPPKKAKESLDENAIPISETLAKIYAAQGNYPKAIHVYHQLMLLNPEKKHILAVRIEELKKKITT